MAIPPSGRGPQLIAVYAFFGALSSVGVALRIYCRAWLLRNFGLDDYLAVVSCALLVLLCCFAITGAHHGSGQHAWDIKPITEIPVGLKWWWRCEPIYVLSNMAIKGSIALMLLRLTIIKAHRLTIWITIVVTEVFSLFFCLFFILQCQPSSYFWTQFTGSKGSCVNPLVTVRITYTYSALICAGDWILAAIPFLLVRKLQMKSREKVLVATILGMAAIASVATVVRIPYLHTLSDKADFLYATVDVAIWSCAELGLAITTASAATLRPLFQTFLSRGKSQNNSICLRRCRAAHSLAPWPSKPSLRQPPPCYLTKPSQHQKIVNDVEYGFDATFTPPSKYTATTSVGEVVHEEDRRDHDRMTFYNTRGSSGDSDVVMLEAKPSHIVDQMRGT